MNLYPLSLIENCAIERTNRVLRDEFENGTTSTRRLWNSLTFKRRFNLQHSYLNRSEMRWLTGFYGAKNGTADSFWFRDNVNRRGNANVRFGGPIQENPERALNRPQVVLEEIAPVRSLPEISDVFDAAGTKPFFWWDANRQRYFQHMGEQVIEDHAHDDCEKYHAYWQGGMVAPTNIEAQWQWWRFAGIYGKSTSPVIELAAGQPAFTLFGFYRHSISTGKQVIAAVGTVGSAKAMGLVLSATNVYQPWVGGSEPWTVSYANGVEAWRSIALVWAAGGTSVSMFVNGALIDIASNARTYAQNGAATLGGADNGTLKVNPDGSMVRADSNHVMGFAAELTQAQIKSLHNTFCWQLGVASV